RLWEAALAANAAFGVRLLRWQARSHSGDVEGQQEMLEVLFYIHAFVGNADDVDSPLIDYIED
ncbi:hypothetical protein A6D6_04143, partial [Alcanivorax xiamenensis]